MLTDVGRLVRPDNYIGGNQGAANIWAKAHFSDDHEIMQSVSEAIRREAEACDHLQAFQICHSIAGGTGSGLGSKILTLLANNYQDQLIETSTIFPSTTSPNSVVEPYNAVLTMYSLTTDSGLVKVFDNDSISKQANTPASHDFSYINDLISQAMSAVTSGFRFPSYNGFGLRKLSTNILPYSWLHFLMVSMGMCQNTG